jgi:hypothetical protein
MPLRLAELHWSAEQIHIWKRNPVQIYVEQVNIPYKSPNCFSGITGRWDEANYGIWGDGVAKDSRQLGRRTYRKVELALGGGGNEYLHWEDQWHPGLSFLAFWNDIA